MDKIKISDHQLFALTANGAIGGSVIVMSSILAGIAKQDAWITGLLTPIFGLFAIWVMTFLGSQYPDMTLIDIIMKILGKWFGSIVAASFVFFCLLTSCHLPWYISNFVTTQVMSETPAYFINSVFVLAIVIGMLYGIESIARASELFIYIASFLFFLAMILVLPNAKIENLQPVLENGITPILKSSVFLSSILTFPLITIMMIYPVNAYNEFKAKRAIFKGYLWAAFIVFVSIIMSISVLGSAITAKSQHPTFLLAREINVGVIFSRLEFIIAVVWIITEFVVSILFFYAGIIGFTQLFGLKNYRKIVIPSGLIILVMSGVALPDTVYQANWFTLVWAPYSMTYGLFLPILLLLIFLIKRSIKNMSKNS